MQYATYSTAPSCPIAPAAASSYGSGRDRFVGSGWTSTYTLLTVQHRTVPAPGTVPQHCTLASGLWYALLIGSWQLG